MRIHNSCKESIESCKQNNQFSIAHLYKDEKTMDIHVHDNYEIYYSKSGGKQFLIDNRLYTFEPGDIFFINQYESHRIMQIDNMTHERIVINIHPQFLRGFSTTDTNINYCFENRNKKIGHRVSLTTEEQSSFLYFVHQLSGKSGFGQDILDTAHFLELMVFLNKIFKKRYEGKEFIKSSSNIANQQIDEILTYINRNIENELLLDEIAAYFYISTSYLCRLFKRATGTTINKYINAKRITMSKALLSQGNSVYETYVKCGYKDYSNFFKVFKKTVGISPSQYSKNS